MDKLSFAELEKLEYAAKPLDYEVDPRFKDTEFLIEADEFAQFALWREWHGRVKWEEESAGLAYTVGEIGGSPVVVSCFWAKLNGHRVCFYNATSRVIDWEMIETWLKRACYPLWDSKTRHAQTNAMNFHHCIDHVLNYEQVALKESAC